MESKRNTYILAKFDVSGIQQYIFANEPAERKCGSFFTGDENIRGVPPLAIEEATDSHKRTILEWEKKKIN